MNGKASKDHELQSNKPVLEPKLARFPLELWPLPPPPEPGDVVGAAVAEGTEYVLVGVKVSILTLLCVRG